MSPDFRPPENAIFPTRYRENGLFKEKPSEKGHFLFMAWENRMSQGVENRGSLIGVSLALRKVSWIAKPIVCKLERLSCFHGMDAFHGGRQVGDILSLRVCEDVWAMCNRHLSYDNGIACIPSLVAPEDNMCIVVVGHGHRSPLC